MLFPRHRIETMLHEGAQCGHAQTARSCRHILRLRSALWTFIDTLGMESTNNHAERTLRNFVLWRSAFVDSRTSFIMSSALRQRGEQLQIITCFPEHYATHLLVY